MTETLTLTVRETARLLGMSESGIYDLVRRGVIPRAPYTGRAVRIPRRAIEQQLVDAGALPAIETVASGVFT